MENLQPKFQENWGIFGILTNFGTKNKVFLPMHRATWCALLLGSSKSQKVYISRFFMKNHGFWFMAKKFGQVLSLQEVKNTKKMTSLPLF